jgi:hypothetical protein
MGRRTTLKKNMFVVDFTKSNKNLRVKYVYSPVKGPDMVRSLSAGQ